MRVMICGDGDVGRPSYEAIGRGARAEMQRASKERAFVMKTLTALHAERGFTHVCAGDEGGAERIGLDWAGLHRVPATRFARERLNFGRETIDQRDMRMLMTTDAQLVVAFGASKSIARFVASAERRGMPVVRIELPESEQAQPEVPAEPAMRRAS